ncbi:hypothetical protein GJAV_G00274920 [Gymnothorax javanicus]|nr:hypothetical protein GJAV_G00274920 [Gymnothorax javanicus]
MRNSSKTVQVILSTSRIHLLKSLVLQRLCKSRTDQPDAPAVAGRPFPERSRQQRYDSGKPLHMTYCDSTTWTCCDETFVSH